MPLLNSLEDKRQMHRRRKELIVIVILASFAISTIYYYSYIIYSPANHSNYARINITCNEKIEKEEYVNCTLELTSKNPNQNIPPMSSKIKLQGMTNAERPKKGYRIELSERISLLDMRKDDDWILFALYLDYPRMRIKLSFDLWRSLESSNPTILFPKSEYVSLYLNGEFKGLYLLAEKIDKRLFNLDKAQNNLNSSLILQAKSNEVFSRYNFHGWEQDWPNEDDGIYIKDKILNELTRFITNSSDEEFFHSENGIYNKFDKLNLIDFFLFNYFQAHTDFWSNNFYVVRNTNPNKFFLVPWDFDGCFGQKGNGKSSPKEDYESLIREVNGLYDRLLDHEEFKLECKDRWFYLREKLLTEENILNKLSDIYKEIKDILEFEVLKWKKSIEREDDGEEFIIDDYINDLFHWIPERLDFCDEIT